MVGLLSICTWIATKYESFKLYNDQDWTLDSLPHPNLFLSCSSLQQIITVALVEGLQCWESSQLTLLFLSCPVDIQYIRKCCWHALNVSRIQPFHTPSNATTLVQVTIVYHLDYCLLTTHSASIIAPTDYFQLSSQRDAFKIKLVLLLPTWLPVSFRVKAKVLAMATALHGLHLSVPSHWPHLSLFNWISWHQSYSCPCCCLNSPIMMPLLGFSTRCLDCSPLWYPLASPLTISGLCWIDTISVMLLPPTDTQSPLSCASYFCHLTYSIFTFFSAFAFCLSPPTRM